MSELFWLNEQMIRAIHADQLSQHGGSSGIRDENLLLASLPSPQNLFAYGKAPTLFDLAAAYGYGLAKNHPFVDGNKRVSFVAMGIFLELNGYSLDVPETNVVVMMERLAMDQENQDSIAEWLRENSLKQ
jgi:death-on-curing protein